MSKYLVYIDQNIIGALLEGILNLSKRPDLYWVYSKKHFAEFRSSSNSDQFLLALEKIDAKLLDLELTSDWKITGNAKLIEHGTPTQHYKAYIESTRETIACENIFDPLLAWVNGGGDEGIFRELPMRVAEQVTSLTKDLPINCNALLDQLKPNFECMIEQMIEKRNEVKKTEKVFGGRSTVGAVSGDNQIHQIWKMISPATPGITCDQFFGFDPVEKLGHETFPLYLGIIGCCAVMDFVGFQAEKKCRKIDKIPNIRRDAEHIAMGAFCTAILSEDKRLIRRAKAIYEYKGISTLPILIERTANPSLKPIAAPSADPA
jgi:hypothetical protein